MKSEVAVSKRGVHSYARGVKSANSEIDRIQHCRLRGQPPESYLITGSYLHLLVTVLHTLPVQGVRIEPVPEAAP